jgi:hypothetical protein
MTEFIFKYFEALWNLSVDMAPYLLLGFLFAGLLKVYLPQDIMNKYLGKSSFKSVLNASLLGIPLPLCSCGVLPAGISLYKNGASKGSSVSFLISTPQTGVDSILVTWSMLGLPLAIIRPIAALVTGLTGGLLTNKIEKKIANTKQPISRKKQNLPKQKKSIKRVLHYAFVEMLMDIAKWLIIGLMIAALISVLLPNNFFTEFKLDGFYGMLIMLVASIPLYVCATSSVPIAAVLLMKGISPGALLVFLMAGPATNAATISVIANNLGKKTMLVYLASIIAGSLAFGLLMDNFLPANWFMPVLGLHEHSHGLLPHWFNVISTLFLIAFLLKGYFKQITNWLLLRKKKKEAVANTPAFGDFTIDIPAMVVGVEGMSCIKCKTKVENGISSIDNVNRVVANIETGELKIYGNPGSVENVKKKLEQLGYGFIALKK